MSYQGYENYPGQQGQQDPGAAGPGGPPQQDPSQMGAQMMGGEGAQFPPANNGQAPASAGPPQDGEQKTTLWYVPAFPTSFQTFVAAPDAARELVSNNQKRGFADRAYRMGELEPWIDENFIRSVWFNMGEQVNVKMIRDKFSG